MRITVANSKKIKMTLYRKLHRMKDISYTKFLLIVGQGLCPFTSYQNFNFNWHNLSQLCKIWSHRGILTYETMYCHLKEDR